MGYSCENLVVCLCCNSQDPDSINLQLIQSSLSTAEGKTTPQTMSSEVASADLIVHCSNPVHTKKRWGALDLLQWRSSFVWNHLNIRSDGFWDNEPVCTDRYNAPTLSLWHYVPGDTFRSSNNTEAVVGTLYVSLSVVVQVSVIAIVP